MARLDLESLSKVYTGKTARGNVRGNGDAAGDVVALRDLSLSVADGELLTLVGPSGCGKTTTLRLIAGLEPPSGGAVRIAGESVTAWSPEQRDVAMVFPRGALYPHLTVYENLAWGVRLRDGGRWAGRLWVKVGGWLGSPRAVEAAQRAAQCDQRVRNVADQLGIGALLDRLPSQLSDGQRQRAALGRAMVRRPSVYLMDEPLTGLDAPLRNQLRRDLKEWHRTAGATVVYVTHDQTEALMLGDRVAVLNEGELQQVGSPRDVYERPGNQFVARFIGNPAMNLIEGRLADGEREGASTFQARAWSLKVPDETLRQHGGRQVVLGIRPEHVIASIGPAGREPAGKEVESGCGGEAPPAAQTIEVSGVVRFTESAGDVHWAYVEPVADSSAPAPQCLSSVPRLSSVPQADCLTAKWRPDEQPRSGDVVRLSLNCRRFHWFDAASGANLTLPQSR